MTLTSYIVSHDVEDHYFSFLLGKLTLLTELWVSLMAACKCWDNNVKAQ